MAEIIPWFEDPEGAASADAARILVDLFLDYPDVGNTVAKLPWVVDGASQVEVDLLWSLQRIADVDSDLAGRIIALPWLASDVTSDGLSDLQSFDRVASQDIESARQIAAIPWFMDGLDRYEQSAINHIGSFIGSADELDRRLAQQVVNAGWFTDGVTWRKAWTIGVLASVSRTYREVLPAIVEFDWAFDDDLTWHEFNVVTNIRDLELFNPGSGVMLVQFQWLYDGITDSEGGALSVIRHLAEFNPEFSVWLIESPWVADGITSYSEVQLMRGLGNIFAVAGTLDRDPFKLLSLLVDEADGPYSPIEGMLMRSLGQGLEDEETRRKLLEEMMAADWFVDGLTDIERVHIIGLSSENAYYQEWPNLNSEKVHSRTIDLPLAGEVNLWLMEGSTVSWESAMYWFEEAVRGAEQLMEEPFPFSELVVATVGRYDYDGRARTVVGQSYDGGQRIEIGDNLSDKGMRDVLHHEVAHSYFNSLMGPKWFAEAGAEYVREYIQKWKGYADQDAHIRVMNLVRDDCTSKGVLQIVEALVDSPGIPPFCKFKIGLHLLLSLEREIGFEAVVAALGDLHRTGLASQVPNSDRDIYEAFLRHTPTGKENKMQEIWDRLYGSSDW
ncbi:MAG: hypothetical protein OXP10_04185 [Chloroflexota bacterium]|nr:hypothetical protein [Chloroflexota bacterium]